MWSCIFTPPYVFVTWEITFPYLTHEKNNFSLKQFGGLSVSYFCEFVMSNVDILCRPMFGIGHSSQSLAVLYLA
jgi:hypothetical protein